MVFNFLNQNILRDVEQPTSITEKEFWQQFFIMQSLHKPVELTNKEIEILADVLARDPEVNWFDFPYYEEIAEKYEMSSSYFKQVFYAIRRKGYIFTDENKITWLDPNLEKFQKQMKKYFNTVSNQVYFFYPYNIVNDDSQDNEQTDPDDQEA